MQYEIVCQPDFAMCNVKLEQDERIVVESGAMVAMTSNIQVETRARGGFIAGARRKLIGGESFFINTYWPEGGAGNLHIAPGVPGDIVALPLQHKTLTIQSGSFLACSPNISLDTTWGGAKAFFAREGLFFLKAKGEGVIFFTSFGAIHEIDVEGTHTVDTGHIVAFENTLEYDVRSIGGLKAFLFSGEGLVCDFSGQGKLYIQSRSPEMFAEWVHPFRKIKSSS